jgi:5,10-methylenetetrahydromethanopterin reductase
LRASWTISSATWFRFTGLRVPDDCRAKVEEYVEAGCTCPVLYPLGDDVPAMIEAFAAVRV